MSNTDSSEEVTDIKKEIDKFKSDFNSIMSKRSAM